MSSAAAKTQTSPKVETFGQTMGLPPRRFGFLTLGAYLGRDSVASVIACFDPASYASSA